MSFTDDDLKRLKELDRGASTTIGSDDLRALIARPEAAERTIKAWENFSLELHSRVRDTKREFELRMTKANATEAWRKVAGK